MIKSGFGGQKRSNYLHFCLLLRLLRLQIDHWSDLQNDTYQTKPYQRIRAPTKKDILSKKREP